MFGVGQKMVVNTAIITTPRMPKVVNILLVENFRVGLSVSLANGSTAGAAITAGIGVDGKLNYSAGFGIQCDRA